MKYSVMDLFCGAGGLSLGFEQTDKFEIKVAFEKNISAQITYKKNHKDTVVYSNVNNANYNKIIKKYGPIDVIIGDPPYQGFFNENFQNDRFINRNKKLIIEYVRAISEVKPEAFVMENVTMLKSDVHKFYLDKHDLKNKKINNIPLSEDSILLLDKKYFFYTAFSIINNINNISYNSWEIKDYNTLLALFRLRNNKNKLEAFIKNNTDKIIDLISSLNLFSCTDSHIYKQTNEIIKHLESLINGDEISDCFIETLISAISTQQMLHIAKDLHKHQLCIDEFYLNSGNICAKLKAFSIIDYINYNIADTYAIDDGILSAIDFSVPQKRLRFIMMGIKKEINKKISLPKNETKKTTVKDAIIDLEKITPIYNFKKDVGIEVDNSNYKPRSKKLFNQLHDNNKIYNHIIAKTSDVALERFKQIKPGKNFHSLSEEYKNNTYIDYSKTQNTSYQRLKYNEPSTTVVNVRKSMWIHPTLDRGISVREAARLQTFPDSYRFYGNKDSQFQQVGEAVPPLMAKSIALQLYDALQK